MTKRSAWVLALVAALAVGCDDDDDNGGNSQTADMGTPGAGGMGGDPGMGGAPGMGGTPGMGGAPGMGGTPGAGGEPGMGGAIEQTAGPLNGSWIAGIKLVEFANVVIPLKIDIRANTADGQGTIFDATFSAVDMDGNASDPIVVVEDIPVTGGKFEIAFDMATLPAAYSPSFSDVVFSPVIAAEIQGADFFCGMVTGRVDTFDQALEASTFGAAPFGSTDTPPTDCSGEGPPMFDRIEDCPALAPGRNTMFPSAGFERTFDLYLPQGADPAEPAPLVFLWHGLGGDADEFIARTEMDTYVDDMGFVLVVPTSMQGGVEWDQLTLDDNPDLTFFDDMVTCVTEQYNVDADRIHATGLSAGGLFSSYLGIQRPAVLASVAPFSGGFLAGYPDPEPTIPYMVSWGGEMDLAFDQNFNELAMRMIGTLTENGHGLVTCNHNLEHVWEAEFTPWALRYLFDHPKGAQAPYAAGLPDAFPDYCNFVQ